VAGNEKRRVLAKNTSTLKEKCDGNNSHLNQPIKNLHIIKKIKSKAINKQIIT
jgi:hypothetical protein